MKFNNQKQIESFEPMILMSASGMEIEGTEAADYLAGTDGDDVITAGGGNDEIYYTNGDDTVDGGSGRDTFYVYVAASDDFVVSKDSDGNTVLKNRNSQDVTILSNVEYVGFEDGLLNTADVSAGGSTGGNSDPQAEKDYYETPQDETIWGNVLDNDHDPDGDDLIVTLEEGPESGSLLLNEDGSFDYIPEPGFVGKVTFTYSVSDGNGGSDTAEVCITVGEIDPDVEPDDDDDDDPSNKSGSGKKKH
jgi:hypothetical protein